MDREDYQEALDKFNHFKLDENIGRDNPLDRFIPDLFITAAVRMDAMDRGAMRALDIVNVGRRKTRAVGIKQQHARRQTAVESPN